MKGFHGCSQLAVDSPTAIALHLEIPGGTGAGALRFTRGVIARFVHPEAVFLGDILGYLQRQPEGIVQEKGVSAGDVALSDGAAGGHDFIEARQALIQRA